MNFPENAALQIFATKHEYTNDIIAVMSMVGMEMPDLIMVIDPTLEPDAAIKPLRAVGEFCYRYMVVNQHCLELYGDMVDTLPDEFKMYNVDLDNPIGKLDLTNINKVTTAYIEGCKQSNVTPSPLGAYHIRTKSADTDKAFFNLTPAYIPFRKFNSPINVNTLLEFVKGNINIDDLKDDVMSELHLRKCDIACGDNHTVKATANRAKATDVYRKMLDTVYHPVINTSLGNVNGVNTIYANSFNLADWVNQPDMPEIVAVIAAHSAMDATKVNEIITAYYDRIVTHYNNGGSLDDVMEVAGYYVYSIEVDVMADAIRPRLLLEDLELTHLRYRQMLLNPIVADDEHKLSSGHYIIQTTGVPSNVAVQ